MQIPFVGGAYEDRSTFLNPQRCVNLYPVLDREGGKYPTALYGCPGLALFCNTGTTAVVRGMIVVGSYLYAVVGATFYQITTAGVATSKGTLNGATGHCWIEYNGPTGDQIMVVDGTTGYIYDISAETFTEIADADFPGATSLTFQDGYFIISVADTGRFYISGSYDGTSWDATDYATAEGKQDNLVAVKSDHRELWLFGTDSVEIWYDSGNATFPFERKVDEIIEYGCSAASSVTSMYNTIFWLDSHKRVVRAEGYRPQVVSTRQIEYQIGKYSSVSDAVGFNYTQDGHSFYVLTFPTGNATWAYDVSTGLWHERESSPDDGRWRGNCYAYFNGRHYVGDHSNGKIYELSMTTYKDDEWDQKAIRITSPIHKEQKNLFFDKLTVDMEPGVGLDIVDTTDPGYDPQAMLEWSDDGGKTWSNEHWTSMGKIGEYGKRLIWRRLGRSRSRIFRLTITAPVKRVILGANAEVRMGTS